MAKEGQKKPIVIKPGPCLVIKREQGYEFRLIDCGNAGIQLQVCRDNAPCWDRDAAVMLDLEALDRLGYWIAKTSGRPAMVLPPQMQEVLRVVLRKDRNRQSKFLAIDERRILKRALRVLNAILSKRTPSGKRVSLAARAIGR